MEKDMTIGEFWEEERKGFMEEDIHVLTLSILDNIDKFGDGIYDYSFNVVKYYGEPNVIEPVCSLEWVYESLKGKK